MGPGVQLHILSPNPPVLSVYCFWAPFRTQLSYLQLFFSFIWFPFTFLVFIYSTCEKSYCCLLFNFLFEKNFSCLFLWCDTLEFVKEPR